MEESLSRVIARFREKVLTGKPWREVEAEFKRTRDRRRQVTLPTLTYLALEDEDAAA